MPTIGEILKAKLGLLSSPEEELCSLLRQKISHYGHLHIVEYRVGLKPHILNKVVIHYEPYAPIAIAPPTAIEEESNQRFTFEAKDMVAALKDCLRMAEALDKFEGIAP